MAKDKSAKKATAVKPKKAPVEVPVESSDSSSEEEENTASSDAEGSGGESSAESEASDAASESSNGDSSSEEEGSDESADEDDKADAKSAKKKGDAAAAKPLPAAPTSSAAEGQQGALDEGGRSVYISGLPFEYKRKDVEALFEKVGAMITYIHMPVFEDSKRSRGFASVTFTKREYVKLAVELDGSKLPGGRWLKVEPLDKARVNKKKQGKKDAKAIKNKAAEAGAVTGANAEQKKRARRYTERPEGCNKVYAGNMPLETTEAEIRDLFGRCGTIKSISMIQDYHTGNFKGFAFIEFEPNPEDEPTEKAYFMSERVRIHANKIFIDYAPDTAVCYRCKSKDHKGRDCPLYRAKRQKTADENGDDE